MAKRRSARVRKSPTPKAARRSVSPVGPAPVPLGPLVDVASAIGAAAATIKAVATGIASGGLAPTVVRGSVRVTPARGALLSARGRGPRRVVFSGIDPRTGKSFTPPTVAPNPNFPGDVIESEAGPIGFFVGF